MKTTILFWSSDLTSNPVHSVVVVNRLIRVINHIDILVRLRDGNNCCAIIHQIDRFRVSYKVSDNQMLGCYGICSMDLGTYQCGNTFQG